MLTETGGRGRQQRQSNKTPTSPRPDIEEKAKLSHRYELAQAYSKPYFIIIVSESNKVKTQR
jgi:hypothetical protein